jgi:hypothetical protein
MSKHPKPVTTAGRSEVAQINRNPTAKWRVASALIAIRCFAEIADAATSERRWSRERWRSGYRGRVVCHILPARGARRQSTPDGLLRHIFAVGSYHSLTGVAAADIDPAVTRGAGPLPAEQLSAAPILNSAMATASAAFSSGA